MPTRVSVTTPEFDSAEDAWSALCAVLEGKLRPPLEDESLKLVNSIAAAPCDVRLRPARFEAWRVERSVHHDYRPELAPAVVHHMMRRLGLSRVSGPMVGVLHRLGLGARFEVCDGLAVWLVPGHQQLEILVRATPLGLDAHVAVTPPEHGPWAIPAPCARPETHWVEADRACPYCKARPARFRALSQGSVRVCPDCGRSFEIPRPG
jgi:hypothetical protein